MIIRNPREVDTNTELSAQFSRLQTEYDHSKISFILLPGGKFKLNRHFQKNEESHGILRQFCIKNNLREEWINLIMSTL